MLQMLMNGDVSIVRFDGSFGKVLASPKYDGFCVAIVPERSVQTKNDVKAEVYVLTRTMTRNGLYVANHYVRQMLDALPPGLHGELVAVDDSEGAEAHFSVSQSMLKRQYGEPRFNYNVFNFFGDGSDEYCALPYSRRMRDAQEAVAQLNAPWLHFAPNVEIETVEQLEQLIVNNLALGYEGTVVTYSDVPYLRKRCSKTAPYALKFKDVGDSEFTVIAVIEEVYHDVETNRRDCPELIGQGKGFAASFVCAPRAPFTKEFRAPLAVPEHVARDYWERRESLIGEQVNVIYTAAGNVDRPRHPRCRGIREVADIL